MSAPPIDATFIAFQEAIAGRYSLERELGRGGMGIVYLAREVRLDRRVAIKLLPPEMAAQDSLRERFLREARTAARLSHPYIVPIHAVDDVGGFVFYVMAYVEGETLAQRVASRGPLSPSDATRLLREVAWALAYAHAQGVVHRDVKPANILLEHGSGRAMVTDFGIARVVHADGETAVGELLGTPHYMSPEQAAGEPVDGRSDLYSLGVVGWFALTGRLPFDAPTAQALLAQHMTKPAPPLASVAHGIPRALAQAVDRSLEKDAAQRFATGEALADALAPSLEKHTEVPVPIRIFLDRRRIVPLVIPLAMGMPMVTGLIVGVVQFGANAPRIAALVLVTAGVLALPVLIILRRLRRLARLGYGTEDIVAGMRTAFAREREEFQFEHGRTPSGRERVARILGSAGLGTGVVGAASMIFGAPPEVVAPITVIATYAGVIGTALHAKWSRLRKATGSVWTRFWEGRVGTMLGRLASYKLGAHAVPADRGTELAIAMSASALYDALPKETRASLGDVPGALQALEEHARALRRRIEQLDGAIADAQLSRAGAAAASAKDALVADLRQARNAAEARLAEVVTALETLRLDLLRLSAGAGTAEGVTRAVESARELSEEAERMLIGQREVDRALADTPR